MTRRRSPTLLSLPYMLLAVLVRYHCCCPSLCIVILPYMSLLSIPHVTLSGEGIVMHCCCWPSPCIVIIIVCRPFDLQRPCCHYLVGALLVIGHQSSPAASVVIIHCHHVWREGKGGGQHHHSLVGLVGCWSSCMEGEPGG